MVHIYKGILLSHKKEQIWANSDEVDKPRTYYTEWSESGRDKYHILMYIYGIWKNGSEEFIYRAAMEKQTENRPMPMGRGEERVPGCSPRAIGQITFLDLRFGK